MSSTFEHPLLNNWLEFMDISRVPRSGANDPAIGILISDSANITMGKTPIKLIQPLSEKNLTIFNIHSKYNLVDLMKIWSESHQRDGLSRIESLCEENFETAKTKIFRDLANNNPDRWKKLSEDKKYELGYKELQNYFFRELEGKNKNLLIIDEALCDIYEQAYTAAKPHYLRPIASWCAKTKLEPNQTPGFFFARAVITGSKTEIFNDFFLQNYNKIESASQCKFMPCPLELCKRQFNQQRVRTKVLWDISHRMKQNWPSANGQNQELHDSLDEAWQNMKSINTKLVRHCDEILKETVAEQQIGELEFLDEKKQPIPVDFSTYKSGFENAINTFQADINADFNFQSNVDSDQELFDSVFDESKGLKLDNEPPRSKLKYTRYVKPFKHEFTMPPEKYLLSETEYDNLASMTEPSSKEYVC